MSAYSLDEKALVCERPKLARPSWTGLRHRTEGHQFSIRVAPWRERRWRLFQLFKYTQPPQAFALERTECFIFISSGMRHNRSWWKQA